MKSDPHRFRLHSIVALVFLALLQASWAAADVAPPDQCNVEGATCEIGSGASASRTWSGSVGLCTRSRCTRYYPEYPDSGTGGAGPIFRPHEEDCLRCIVGASADAGNVDGDPDQGCGCGLPGMEGEAPLAVILLGLGVLALRAGRRRR